MNKHWINLYFLDIIIVYHSHFNTQYNVLYICTHTNLFIQLKSHVT